MAGKTGKKNRRVATYAGAVKALNATAANLSNCGTGAWRLVDTIERTDDSLANEIKDCRRLLMNKLENLRNLSALSNRAAEYISNEVGKLVRGNEREEKDWENLQAIIRFTGDQIKSEKEGIGRLMNTLVSSTEQTDRQDH